MPRSNALHDLNPEAPDAPVTPALTMEEAVAELAHIEKRVQQSQTDEAVAQEQIAELRPRYEALSERCQTEFGCTMEQLPEIIAKKERVFIATVSHLRTRLEATDGDGDA